MGEKGSQESQERRRRGEIKPGGRSRERTGSDEGERREKRSAMEETGDEEESTVQDQGGGSSNCLTFDQGVKLWSSSESQNRLDPAEREEEEVGGGPPSLPPLSELRKPAGFHKYLPYLLQYISINAYQVSPTDKNTTALNLKSYDRRKKGERQQMFLSCNQQQVIF